MVVGVALFLRLVQTIFRPVKVSFPCPIVDWTVTIRARFIASTVAVC